MRELLRDPEQMAQIVRRRVLRAMVPALGKLDRVARGHDKFEGDEQRFACVALARLAGTVLGMIEDPEPDTRFSGPEWQTPEQILLFRQVQWLGSLSLEEAQRFEAECEARYAAWESARPDFTKMTCDEICEYSRTHESKSYDEVTDECYPEHLRMSTLKKGDDHE